MPDATLSGSDFKKQLREGKPKMGLFLNAHSPTVAEQLAHSGYDWLLVDTQHGPMGYEKLSAMLSGIANGGAKSMVRVGGYDDRPGIQQAPTAFSSPTLILRKKRARPLVARSIPALELARSISRNAA